MSHDFPQGEGGGAVAAQTPGPSTANGGIIREANIFSPYIPQDNPKLLFNYDEITRSFNPRRVAPSEERNHVAASPASSFNLHHFLGQFANTLSASSKRPRLGLNENENLEEKYSPPYFCNEKQRGLPSPKKESPSNLNKELQNFMGMDIITNSRASTFTVQDNKNNGSVFQLPQLPPLTQITSPQKSKGNDADSRSILFEERDIRISENGNMDDSNCAIQVKKESDLCSIDTPSNEIANVNQFPRQDRGIKNEDLRSSPLLELEDINRTGEGAERQSSDKNVYSCPICDFETDESLVYNQHVVSTHGYVCYNCKFTADSQDALVEHDAFCPGSASANEPEKCLSPPSKQKGKLKKLSCKHCHYVAKDEVDFYKHRRVHINAEKILECPHCPFITQYKHHLDYHLKNHTGNKPYRCDRCDYSCVNKSMLNSHKKSHSNFYSFRCKDCNYEAKYMHALKCHCRKYNHKALPVLNEDGTYNPYSLVDIYGTRRGPKPKRDAQGNIIYPAHYTATIAMQPTTTAAERTTPPSSTATAPSAPVRPVSPIGTSLFYRQDHQQTLPFPAPIPRLDRGFPNKSIFSTPPQLSMAHHSFLYNSPVSPAPALPLPQMFKCQTCDAILPTEELLKQHIIIVHLIKNHAQVETPARPGLYDLPQNRNLDLIARLISASNNSTPINPFLPFSTGLTMNQVSTPNMSTVTPDSIRRESIETTGDSSSPLDLTKDHTPPQLIRRRPAESTAEATPSTLTPPDTCSPPLAVRRSDQHVSSNRRLEVVKDNGGADESEFEIQNSSSVSDGVTPLQRSSESESTGQESNLSAEKESVPSSSESLVCQFCQITFGFRDMYNTHMAFHDESDPLQCSFCKERYDGFNAFFEHCFSCKGRLFLKRKNKN